MRSSDEYLSLPYINMEKLKVLPVNLQKVADEIIYNIHRQLPIPDGLVELIEWLEIDGWDELVGSNACYEFAINLKDFSEFKFNDDELIEYDIIKSKQEATNPIRLNFARNLIDDAFKDCANEVVTLHPFELINSNCEKAFLGCVLEDQGQMGPSLKVDGVFKTADEFFSHEKAKNILTFAEVAKMDDESLLSYWS